MLLLALRLLLGGGGILLGITPLPLAVSLIVGDPWVLVSDMNPNVVLPLLPEGGGGMRGALLSRVVYMLLRPSPSILTVDRHENK